MKKITVLCIIVIMSFISYAFARNECAGVHMGLFSDANGVSTLFCASYDDVVDSPEWDGSTDPLPLSISQAVEIGRKWMKDNNPKLDDFEVRTISINRVGDSRIKNRWYYSIEFQAVVSGRTLYGSPFFVKILMNGVVVESEIEKD